MSKSAFENRPGPSTFLSVRDAAATSDVRSMSVDPGSMDDQLSSQESWDGVTFDEAAKKDGGERDGGGGEYSGGGDGKEEARVGEVGHSTQDVSDSNL